MIVSTEGGIVSVHDSETDVTVTVVHQAHVNRTLVLVNGEKVYPQEVGDVSAGSVLEGGAEAGGEG